MLWEMGTVLLTLFAAAVWQAATPQEKASPQRLRADVERLASLERYYGNVRAMNAAADHMSQQLTAAGARVSEQAYKAAGQRFRNITGTFGPENGELVIVGAHYDSASGLPGADDNASGSAVLLEIARLLKGKELKRPVRLVAFANEEPPFFRSERMGSYVYARMLKESDAKVRGMICLEMVGYFTDKENSQNYPGGWPKVYGNKGDFLVVVGKMGNFRLARRVSGAISKAGVSSHTVIAPVSIAGVDFSDHWSFWEHGFDAVMITDSAFYRNPHYHERSDLPDTLDYKRMAGVAVGVTEAVMKMAR